MRKLGRDTGNIPSPIKRYFKLLANAHGLGGFITPFLSLVSWWLVGFNTFLFLLYEVVEWYQIRNKVYKDVKEWVAGFFAGSVILLVIECILGGC